MSEREPEGCSLIHQLEGSSVEVVRPSPAQFPFEGDVEQVAGGESGPVGQARPSFEVWSRHQRIAQLRIMRMALKS